MKSLTRLDFIRGTAAIMVLTGHLRALIFADYSQQKAVPVLGKIFYFLTGFGHQAVVIFFVLSGFFITKSISGSLKKNQWSAGIYAIHRLSRLWMVLIPGLLLTLVLDQWGIAHFVHPAYTGKIEYLPDVNPAQNTSIAGFFGNLFFLQNLVVPIFGSDAPLWSLCNEFWYYCYLPLLIVPFLLPKRNKLTIALSLLALIALNIILFKLTVGFLIFLMGVTVFFIQTRFKWFASLPFRLLGLVSFLSVLTISRIKNYPPDITDVTLGLVFFILLLGVLNMPEPTGKLFIRISKFLSGFSYTVYIIHLPIALFICGALHLYFRQFSIALLGLYFVLLITILLFARLFYLLFEKNTDKVRRSLENKVSRKKVLVKV